MQYSLFKKYFLDPEEDLWYLRKYTFKIILKIWNELGSKVSAHLITLSLCHEDFVKGYILDFSKLLVILRTYSSVKNSTSACHRCVFSCTLEFLNSFIDSLTVLLRLLNLGALLNQHVKQHIFVFRTNKISRILWPFWAYFELFRGKLG